MSLYSVKGKGWRYDFTLRGQRYTAAWFKTKAEARQAEARRREEVLALPPEPATTGMVTAPTDMAFSMLANDYLDYAQRKFAGKTYAYKAYVYREFLAFTEDIKVKEITISIIDAYLRTRNTNINYNRHRKELSALFNWGYQRRLLAENP